MLRPKSQRLLWDLLVSVRSALVPGSSRIRKGHVFVWPIRDESCWKIIQLSGDVNINDYIHRYAFSPFWLVSKNSLPA